ncbi:MAG: leucine-rich repeat domain-containing protein [Clostridia bacterium]|nr:leucine-rich repeat domain-containing protein [Clostridia bacterium]
MSEFIIKEIEEKVILEKYIGNDTEITIPENITEIKEKSFLDCKNLVKVTIGKNVKIVENNAFYNCENLKEVIIKDEKTIIKEFSFFKCFSINFNMYENAAYLGNCENPYLILFKPINRNITTCTIHKETRVINSFSFRNCKNLVSLTLPENVEFVGKLAFWFCSSLRKLIIYNSGIKIDKDCIEEYDNEIEFIYYGTEKNDFIKNEKVISVFAPNIDFSRVASTYKEKYLSGFLKNYKDYEINPKIFSQYVNYVSNNKTRFFEIFDKNYCQFMTENQILKIEDIDFLIEKMTNENQMEVVATLLDYKNKNFTFKQIEKQFEKSLVEEKKVTLKSLLPIWNIKKLDNGNYEILGYKGNYNEIEFPYKIANSVVESVSLNGSLSENSLEKAKDIKKVVIPEGIKELGMMAFSKCYSLVSLVLPNSLETVRKDAFYRCNALRFNTFENAVYFGTVDNPYYIFIKPVDNNAKSCVIHNDTKIISDGAFGGCRMLRSIIIGDNVKSISKEMFRNCINLKDVKIGRSVEKIEDNAFYNCKGLRILNIPSKVNFIHKNAFENCFYSLNFCIENNPYVETFAKSMKIKYKKVKKID